MGGTEAPQRPVKQDYQVTAHHAWKSLSETDNHPVRMGRKPNQGLLLQPFLLPSDASQKKEQDESGGGHVTQNARLRRHILKEGVVYKDFDNMILTPDTKG